LRQVNLAGVIAGKSLYEKKFTIAEGHWATPRATNRVGLKRAGVPAAEVRNVDRAVLAQSTQAAEAALLDLAR